MAKGDIAALLIGKAKKGPEPATGTMSCSQAVLDAVKAGDAGAVDAALREWMQDYEAEQGGGGSSTPEG